jgi:hypothetical protein
LTLALAAKPADDGSGAGKDAGEPLDIEDIKGKQ